MISKDEAHKKIASLIERFDEQKEFYKRSDYNETLTRRDFIDPFFKALGWDIDNEQGYAESYREVIHEDKIKIGSATKAPDYSFRLGGGKRLFFVEAKKPSVFIKDEIAPAYQVRRYGWSAKLPISIITDFEEFSIYDCTKKPNPTDKASHGRIKYLTYQQYLQEFDFIWDTFSKEKVLKGSFDKFVQSDKQKKGTSTVDYEFLTSLDTWRTYLANNIALRNDIGEDELNFVVQHIIDRLIFLRIAEDRSVERYGNLQDTLKSGDYYENLLKQFHTADQKYNSGLFDFSKDKISGSIAIDNKIIKSIINDLYYPISPYEFSVISVEILGSAYEQFLGKTISLSKGGRAVIEEKPEVRKAGGVYYTPQYIVEYIVKNTVGKLIDGKAPKDISKIKVVDPACGSGSFLIGAYQYLLQHHKDYYTNNGKPSKGSKDNPLTPEGNLTTAEKKRILLNNIYGVDLDANAVEVTKLSLLLKCMEGETEASISSQLKLFHERVLPTLDGNIKDGNSLIDIDFYASEIDFGEEKKIKPFNWKKAFPEVFKQGGFDCVIGNPPYLGFQEGTLQVKEYYVKAYQSARGKYDHYILFIEKALNSLSADGAMLSMIFPNKFMLSAYGKAIKEVMLAYTIEEVVDFNDLQIFSNATTYTCIITLQKKKVHRNEINYRSIKTIDSGVFKGPELKVMQNKLNSGPWIFSSTNEKIILEKIKADALPLSEYSLNITQGLRTGSLKVFFNNINADVIKNLRIETTIIKPVFHGKNIKRYESSFDSSNDLLLFPYDEKLKPVVEKLFPHAFNYLKAHKQELAERKDSGKIFKNTSKIWFEYWDPKPLCFQAPKIIFPDISKQNNFFLDLKGYGYLNSCYAIFLKEDINYYFVLGILNSSLIEFFVKKICPFIRGGYYRYKTNYISQIPIKHFGSQDKRHQENQKAVIDSVKVLLDLQVEKQQQTLKSKLDQIQNRIDYFEQRINEIVYELYGLTKEEIAVIEKA